MGNKKCKLGCKREKEKRENGGRRKKEVLNGLQKRKREETENVGSKKC